MKNKSTFVKLMSLALLGATLSIYTASRIGAASASAAPATAAQSAVTSTTEFSPGGIHIGRGQTASIIAILRPDPNGRDQQPVEVEFIFHDWEGNLLGSDRRILLPGHAASFETRGIISINQGQTEIQPCIKIMVDPTDPRADRIVGTLEVCDAATGKAQVAVICRKAGGAAQ